VILLNKLKESVHFAVFGVQYPACRGVMMLRVCNDTLLFSCQVLSEIHTFSVFPDLPCKLLWHCACTCLSFFCNYVFLGPCKAPRGPLHRYIGKSVCSGSDTFHILCFQTCQTKLLHSICMCVRFLKLGVLGPCKASGGLWPTAPVYWKKCL